MARLPRSPHPSDPTAPSRPAVPSDALLLALPEGAGAEEVQAVVARAVGELVPALGYDITRDVQARGV